MDSVNVHDAKTHFSKLLERVARGEEVVIAKAGRPVARLVPFQAAPATRSPGSARGQVSVHEDFDAPLPSDIQAMFE